MKKIALIKHHGYTENNVSRVSVTFRDMKVFIEFDNDCTHVYEVVIKHWDIVAKKWADKSLKESKKQGYACRTEIVCGEPVYISGIDSYGIEFEILYKETEAQHD